MFEFNRALLYFLADEIYSMKFGTFLFNCEQERKEAKTSQKTQSLWTHLQYEKKRFVNPFY